MTPTGECARAVTFQFEKCNSALGRRVGHDALQTSRARRGKSRSAIPLASFGGLVCNVCIEMEDQAMSLIRKGYAVSTRGGFLGALFSALLVTRMPRQKTVTPR